MLKVKTESHSVTKNRCIRAQLAILQMINEKSIASYTSERTDFAPSFENISMYFFRTWKAS